MPSPIPRATLLLGGLAAGLAVAEGAARVHDGTTVFPWDEPGRGFATAPHTRGANAHGFHEREVEAAPDPTVRRVAVLGDSMTWGTAAPEETFAREAERALGPPWQVLNFSHYGYDAGQAAATLRHRVQAYAPDVVVFATYVNDLVPTRIITVGEPPMRVWVAPEPALLPGPLRRSAMLRVLEGALLEPRDTPEPSAYRAALADMAARCAERGVPLLVFGLVAHVLAGDEVGCDARAGAPGRCAEQRAAHEAQAAIAGELGLRWVSALPAMRAAGVDAFWPDDPADWEHPGPEGHRVLGRALAEALR